MGDLVGYANRPLEEARFIPTPTGTLPQAVNRELRCAHCNGRLSLDDVEPLGRGVSLAEVGGIRLSHILMSPRTRSRTLGA